MQDALNHMRAANISVATPVGDRLDARLLVLKRQHVDLFALVHLYCTSIRSRPEESLVLEMIENVLHFTERHFLTEEKLLAGLPTVNRPRLQHHQAEHRRILDGLAALIDTTAGKKRNSWFDMEHAMDCLIVHHMRHDSEYIRDWLINH